MTTTYRHLDVQLDREDPDVFKILQELRPNWTREKTDVKSLSGGILNKTLKIVHDGDTQDGLILRIDGPVPEQVGLSRFRERECVRHLNARGVGVPLLASFTNGIVTRLLPGQPLDLGAEEMSDIAFARRVAGMLAEIHHAAPSDSDPTSSGGGRCSTFALAKASIGVLRTMTNSAYVKKFLEGGTSFDEISVELDALLEELESLNIPTGLAHNDIWQPNLLYEKSSGELNIIDYEMMDVNFLPFDLASYLVCIPGLPPDTSKEASPEFCRDFIRAYLQRKLQLEGKPEDSLTEKEVEKYYVWTCKCSMLFLLGNTPYALFIGYYTQEEELDMVGLMLLFVKHYRTLKERYKSLTMPK